MDSYCTYSNEKEGIQKQIIGIHHSTHSIDIYIHTYGIYYSMNNNNFLQRVVFARSLEECKKMIM